MQTDMSPAENVADVSLSDTAIVKARALYVGTGGNLKVTVNGVTVTLKNVPSGVILPIRNPVCWTTSTAADIVALY